MLALHEAIVAVVTQRERTRPFRPDGHLDSNIKAIVDIKVGFLSFLPQQSSSRAYIDFTDHD